ncbi:MULTISPECIES: phosphate regulon sensor histidine kinase PhoR [Gammaproteobacteria]|uniref:phosphate regulon sensor histidine kinase PhoR n=1 Tax=Gammaproteobacteria TaxID=1236 RepID=UPI000DCF801A|nr:MULTISPECIES: phosphate regulon sensor histidine kinase PhoR [Gammaproteobacteria]RTE85541.1 phosphate regulon sensor histidine kinase PhoR [Aliidiomarina sp. B3213]TCZ89511.1 phosphate regulon sensor histidine kinase PhoR [Lysobacter sp. N42]
MERDYNFARLLIRIVVICAGLAAIGSIWGISAELIALFLFGLIVWGLFYQQRLSKWLWQSRTMHPPQAPGTWSDIYDGIYRTLRRSQLRRRNLAMILQRFREAAESIPDAGMVLEASGNLVWANRLAQLYFGLKWPADKGIRITNFIRHPRFVKYFRKGDFKESITLSSPVGDSRMIELRIMPYAGKQWLVIARDVTRISKLERMRKDFVANVSHELKTPLTVMQGYLELMEDPELMPPKQMKKAIRDITSQTGRMQIMVEQLLTLSRMEAQGSDVSDVIRVKQLTERLLADLKIMAESKDQTLQVEIDDSIIVQGSEEKLSAAIQNLVVNAIKYTPTEGIIKVSWKMNMQGAEFSVTDNGHGISAEHLPRLTERFYRVEDDRNSGTGGTGLGLSIVKHSLEHHRSYLQVQSVLGKGSTFSFVIPHSLLLSAAS